MSWKDKTCETCEYEINEFCRRFPPAYSERYIYYPCVRNMFSAGNEVWQKACAEYKPKLGGMNEMDKGR